MGCFCLHGAISHNTFCEAFLNGMQANVRLMIDAEHSYFQPAIDHATLELQRFFNVHKPTVFNTIQGYTTVCTSRSVCSFAPIM